MDKHCNHGDFDEVFLSCGGLILDTKRVNHKVDYIISVHKDGIKWKLYDGCHYLMCGTYGSNDRKLDVDKGDSPLLIGVEKWASKRQAEKYE